MRNSNNNPYEKDFYKWTQVQASLLKSGKFEKVDLYHIIEEIESLGRSDKRALKSYLIVLLQHLLKNTYTPDKKGNSRSWDATILNARVGIQSLLKDSPSLKKEILNILKESYEIALELALVETNSIYTEEKIFPKKCPWTIKEIMNVDNL